MMKRFLTAAAGAAALMTAACAGGVGGVTGGAGGTSLQGAAAGGTSAGAENIVRCDETLGTLAVDDGRDKSWYNYYRSTTGVTSLEPMIRLMVQQSNCFVLTSYGNQRLDDRMSDIMDKQRNSGETRAGSNLQKGQRVAADYYLEPSILFSQSDGGGIGGVAGSLFGRTAGAIAGGMAKKKNTVVNMSMFDLRSGIQIAASEGSASVSELGGGVAGLFGGAGGALGGYTKTPEGKSSVEAFLDAYNSMVVALRNYQAQDVEGGLGTGGTLEIN